jgi:hypothetical protein
MNLLAACDFCHALRWYHSPSLNRCRYAAALSLEGAMTERDLTEREDRLLFFGLAAAAILIGLLFMFSIP